MIGEMLHEAESSAALRRADLDAFDRKLSELSGKTKAENEHLVRLSTRRAGLEEEIYALEKHVDDLRFLANSLSKLKSESRNRDQLQNEAMNQIKLTEDARAQLEVEVYQVRHALQDLADVVEVLTGVVIPAPPPPQLGPLVEDSVELFAEDSEEIVFE